MTSLALTFDDGPDPVWTAKLLDLLDRLDAHVSFFPIARRAQEAPDLVARMIEAGHAVGLHCDEHIRHTDRDRAWLEADTERALGRLAEVGVRPSLWRTPWGATAIHTQAVADARRLRVIGWTVDTHDWRGDTAAAMFESSQPDLHTGAVILAHDGIGPGARRENARETLAYVERTAEHAARQGLALEALR